MICGVPILAWSIGSRIQDDWRQKRTQTMINSREITLGMLMYVSDYDDVFPYPQDSKTAMVVTWPYVKSPSYFKTLNPAGGEFVFNLKIGGVDLNTISNPSKTPVYTESKAWPDGSKVVSYADAKVRSEAAVNWPVVAKALAQSFKRAAKKPFPANYAQTLAKQTGIKF